MQPYSVILAKNVPFSRMHPENASYIFYKEIYLIKKFCKNKTTTTKEWF